MRNLTVLASIFFFLFVSTPAQASTYAPDTIVGDVTWTKAQSPYVITVDVVRIPLDASLTILPGVIVKVAEGSSPFVVDGRLTVGMANGEQVYITSLKDDSIGGDTNGDGTTTTPHAGDWETMYFSYTSIVNITNTSIIYGGSSRYNPDRDAYYYLPLMQNVGGTLTIDHSYFGHTENIALRQEYGTTTITASVFDHITASTTPSTFNSFSQLGILTGQGSLTVASTTFDTMERGIVVINGSLELSGNTFLHVASHAVSINGFFSSLVNHGGNTGTSSIFIDAQKISGARVFPKDGLVYLIGNLFIPVGSTLIIEPGAIVKLNQPLGGSCTEPCYGNISVKGRLIVGALNAPERTVMTSIADDSVGGDTNRDGTTTTPAPGGWSGILVNPGGILELYRADIRYGGLCRIPSVFCFYPEMIQQVTNWGGTVIMDNVDLGYGYKTNYHQQGGGTTTIRNSHIHNAENGLTFWSGSATINDNSFSATGKAITYVGDVQFIHQGNHGSGGIALSSFFHSDVTLTPDTLPYSLGWLVVPKGKTLTVLPGVVIKGTPVLSVSGTLVMGSSASTDEVVMTSLRDDTVGGDTNGDGNTTLPSSGDWGTVFIEYGGIGNISNTTFRYGGKSPCETGRSNYCPSSVIENYGTLTFDHSVVTGGKERLIFSIGTTTITTSVFTHGTTGISVIGGTTVIHGSSIHDNSEYGMLNNYVNIVDATNNYWGSPTGPTHPSNLGGTGDRVSGNVDFTPWLTQEPSMTNEPTICVIDCNSSVLFLPGLQASRLYEKDSFGYERRRWEPKENLDVKNLFLDETGKHPAYPANINAQIYTRDVIDEAYPDKFTVTAPNIYESFIADMDDLKNHQHKIADWEAAPYDWRLSIDDILASGKVTPDGISYLSATTSPYIIQELKRLAAGSRTGKVTIIAHSNGGLVAKALMAKLGTTTAAALIDKVILVASPQVGTPEAIGGLLHGLDQGIPSIPLYLSPDTARALAKNLPGVYTLLPSAAYFSGMGSAVTDPVATFDANAPQVALFRNAYGSAITTQGALEQFLLGNEGRPTPTFDNMAYPTTLNSGLLTQADTLHALIDSWVPPASIKIYQIAGWGNDTVSGIRYKQGSWFHCLGLDQCIDYEPILKEDGDGTVVVPSALAMSTSTENVRRWWVNLADYNKLKHANISRDHKDILEVPNLLDFISDTLIGVSKPLTSYTYLSTSTPPSTSTKKLRYFLHSPLSLDLYDDAGHHTGISTTTGMIDNQISGAYYRTFGEIKYITAPADTPLHIVLNGQASGYFTLNVQEVTGDTITATTSFVDIPTATSTKVTMNFPDGSIINAGALTIDEDGNGTTDFVFAPKLNDTVTLPPYSFSGFLQPINDTTINPSQSTSVFKGGSTIPVKFQLKNASGTPIQAKTLPVWLAPQKLSAMSSSANESSLADSGTSGTTFKWDSTSQQYVYNWSTKGLIAGYWYRIAAQFDNGKIYAVTVGVR